MTIYLSALSNDRARLIHKEARVTCAETADMIASTWDAAGFLVVRREED